MVPGHQTGRKCLQALLCLLAAFQNGRHLEGVAILAIIETTLILRTSELGRPLEWIGNRWLDRQRGQSTVQYFFNHSSVLFRADLWF